jgi:hypothetical protein
MDEHGLDQPVHINWVVPLTHHIQAALLLR